MIAAAKLDPRSKLVLTACITSAAVIISNWVYLSGMLVLSILLLIAFAVNPVSMIKRIRMLLYMLVFIAIMQSLFTGRGEVLLSAAGINLLTSGGVILAGEFILRMLIIITSAGILSTSNSREIIQGLVQLKLPYEVAFMAAMGIRFLPLFAEEFNNAMIAIQLRGIDLKALSLKQKTEVFTGIFQPVVAGALIKAKAISMSVDMRGFRACPKRTSYMVLKYKGIDYLVMTAACILTVIVMVCYFSSGII